MKLESCARKDHIRVGLGWTPQERRKRGTAHDVGRKTREQRDRGGSDKKWSTPRAPLPWGEGIGPLPATASIAARKVSW